MTKEVPTKHYRKHPSGVECIEVSRHMNFNLGNALKYIWRADHKGNQVQDLRKAAWYVLDELYRITGDSYYLNKRAEIEGYIVSIEPLKGLPETVEVKEDNDGPKCPNHLTIPFNSKDPRLTFTKYADNLPHKDNETNLTNIPVTC